MAVPEGLKERLAEVSLCSSELYDDEVFPPTNSSLYGAEVELARPHEEWARAADICEGALSLFVDSTGDADACVGELRDQWFLGALACVARRRDLVRNLIVAAVPDAGFYQMQFHKGAEWLIVTLDDFVPVKGTRPRYARSPDVHEFWASLLEKAYSKLHGSYAALEVVGLVQGPAAVGFALADLTGGAVLPLECRAHYWPQLLTARREGWLVAGQAAGSSAPTRPGSPPPPASLAPGLVYSIVDAREIRGERLVRVRNPHAPRGVWNGRFSVSAPDLPADLRAQLYPPDGSDESRGGYFWMAWADCEKAFAGLFVCRLYADGDKWHVLTCEARPPGPTVQFVLQVGDAADVCIQLRQADSALLAVLDVPTPPCHLESALYRAPDNEGPAHSLLIIDSFPRVWDRAGTMHRDLVRAGRLDGGAYVLECSCAPGESLLVSVYSVARVELRALDLPLQQLIRKTPSRAVSAWRVAERPSPSPGRVASMSVTSPLVAPAAARAKLLAGSAARGSGSFTTSAPLFALSPIPSPAPARVASPALPPEIVSPTSPDKDKDREKSAQMGSPPSAMAKSSALRSPGPGSRIMSLLLPSGVADEMPAPQRSPRPGGASWRMGTPPRVRSEAPWSPTRGQRSQPVSPGREQLLASSVSTSANISRVHSLTITSPTSSQPSASRVSSDSTQDQPPLPSRSNRGSAIGGSGSSRQAAPALPVPDEPPLPSSALLAPKPARPATTTLLPPSADEPPRPLSAVAKTGARSPAPPSSPSPPSLPSSSVAQNTSPRPSGSNPSPRPAGSAIAALGSPRQAAASPATTRLNLGNLGAVSADAPPIPSASASVSSSSAIAIPKQAAPDAPVAALPKLQKGRSQIFNPNTTHIVSSTSPRVTHRLSTSASSLSSQLRVTYPNGDSYEGHSKDGMREGHGIYRYANGDVYMGDFRRGDRDGQGELVCASGERYRGNFRHGQMCGQGEWNRTNGDRYSGTFLNGEFDGAGTLERPQRGTRYEGEFRRGLAQGRGRLRLRNGDTYEGTFQDGLMEGEGTYTYANGDTYVGEFRHDLMHGQGEYRFAASGDRYVGTFADGRMHGQGEYHHARSPPTITRGVWRAGTLVQRYVSSAAS